MTRWVGFVLGAVLTLATVHRLGVCDLAPVGSDALAVGRAILARLPAEPEPPQEPASPGAGPGRERPVRGADDQADAADPLGGILRTPDDRRISRDEEPATEDDPARNAVAGPEPGVSDASPASDRPGVGSARPQARPGEDTSGGAFATVAGGAGLPAASIWAPFRSRRSAEGFAGHLHERFGSELEVRRAGPGIYGVYLVAATEDELADDLARLRSSGAVPGPEDPR